MHNHDKPLVPNHTGARVLSRGPNLMPQLTWPEYNHALEPESEFPGRSTCMESALARKGSNFKILLGYACDTLEAQSLDYLFLAHGYDVLLAPSDRELLEAAGDGTAFDTIIVDQTITDQTLDDLCQIPRTFFVPIIEFTGTQPRGRFISAAIIKPCKTEGIIRKIDAVISIARDVRQNGYLRAAYPELAELDKLFGPVGG